MLRKHPFSNTIINMCSVEFTVGDKEVRRFRMIERHYYGKKLLKCFDFDFGFCMPNSQNTCEHIYEMPPMTPQESKLVNDVKPCMVLLLV